MNPIEWTDEKFSVGHPQLDAQHKVLVNMINELIEIQKGRFQQKRQRDILKKLEAYVEKHLHYEEALLEKAGYVELADHQELHSQYMMEIEMWAMMMEDDDPELPKRMCRFLANWLQEHILGEDMKFKETVVKFQA